MDKAFGLRKFIATIGASAACIGLGFYALMSDKLAGAEFVSVVYATLALVAGFCGINEAGKIFRKKDDS